MQTADLRCPTCRASWRGVNPCARCGADLAVLMRVAHQAWQYREAARLALCAGNRSAEALALALLADRHFAAASEVIEELLAESS